MSKKDQRFYFTKEGIEKLKEELRQLVEEKRPALVKRVARARSFGDLSENSEYSNAREELNILDGRIEELKEILKKAVVVKKKASANSQIVKIGSRVTVATDGQTLTFTLVGEWEADPAAKKISHQSPLGKALLGKKVGDKVEIEAPAGKILYTIKKIE